LLGAGSFAQSMLLPHLRRSSLVRLRSVVTPSGLTARSAAERFGFEQCASDAEGALGDPEVTLVMIASRHDSHADLAVRALNAGKAVYVEKPLALTPSELSAIQEAYKASTSAFLMVGFNRRFAPLVCRLREFLDGTEEPLLMTYRVNAGYVPHEHWTQDLETGGGRILGEMCHFVDLLLFLASQRPIQVFAHVLPDMGHYSQDNVAVMIHFADGSVGTITYAANGDPGLGKERLEVFAGGRAAVLDDYRRLTLSVGSRRTVEKRRPDKGHRAEMESLIHALRNGSPSPVQFEAAALSTLTTFSILESLRTGQPTPV
jgi:predicted dehydrogenase